MTLENKALEFVEQVEKYFHNQGVNADYPGGFGVDVNLKLAQIYATLAVAEQLSKLSPGPRSGGRINYET